MRGLARSLEHRSFASRRGAVALVAVLTVVASAAIAVAPGPHALATVTPPSAGSPPPVPAAAQAYNDSPSSRVVSPVAVTASSGLVVNPNGGIGTGNGTVMLGQVGSLVTYDFGKEVGGQIQLTFTGQNSGQQLGVAYTESKLFTGTSSDNSTGGSPDLSMDMPMLGGGTGVSLVPSSQLRGGFRYVTFFLRTGGTVSFDDVKVNITFAPGKAVPSNYANYFLSSDPLLNRIWYAGAYTVQTNTIDPHQGRVWPPPSAGTGWNNSGTIAGGTTVLADGAKRDRTVWPGDLAVSLPTEYVSTDDLVSTKNALDEMYSLERQTPEWLGGGVKQVYELPYAGAPISFYGSDTYHLATLLGTSMYLQYSDDAAWAASTWSKYELGLEYVSALIDGNGLVNILHGADWGRSVATTGESLEANVLAYAVFRGAAFVARTYRNDAAAAAGYDQQADNLRGAMEARLFDAARGLYRDSYQSTVYPQDGNALALWFGVATWQKHLVATKLRQQFGPYGAVTPERTNAVATYPGSMEVHGLFSAHEDAMALDLIRREWGYMLDSPNGTKSTFWEGLKTDGSFDYATGYTSLSHGWATGPTSALTFYTLGLQPVVHSQFRFAPQPGDLTSAQGRLTLPGGVADAAWTHDPVTGRLTARVSAYAGTSISQIAIPKNGNPNMWISVNGADVWRFGSPVSGSPYAVTQDANAVYVSGDPGAALPSGRYDIVATTDAVWDSSYQTCATENATCSVSGSRIVAFGASNRWVYKWVTGSVSCSVDGFGSDPAWGVVKKCYAAPGGSARFDLPETGPAGYTWCGSEWDTCSFGGTHVVAYGGNGSFSYRTLTGGTPCAAAAFGAAPNHLDRADCYVAGADPGPDFYACAAEGGVCSNAGPIWYGANGVYSVVQAASGSSCNNTSMGGDPLPFTVKGCYLYRPRQPT